MDDGVHTRLQEQMKENGKPFGAELEKQRPDLCGKSVAEIVAILTSVPIGREDGIDDPLSQAPPVAPQSPPVVPEPSTLTNASPIVPGIADAPPMAPGIEGPNLDLQPPKSRPFEGEVAVADLGHRLSHDPDLVPEPPIQTRRKPVVARFGGLSFAVIVAAIVAIGVTLMTFPDEVRKQAGDISGMVTPLFEGSSRAGTPTKPARLVVESQKGFANEPLLLGVSLNDASGGETVTLAGLAIGTKLSVGTPLGLTSWWMLARDVGNAFAYAPKDFVGIMDAAIDLHSASDRLMDSQIVRLEWIQKNEERLTPQLDLSKQPATIQTLDPEEIAAFIKHFLKNGDIASARLLLKRAASTGNAQAALELGMTFDPDFLSERGILGSAPDVAQARAWYERAMELGSTEASRRLEGLASMGR
jgi:hypothetical protein